MNDSHVIAYDTRTGKRLEHPVPRAWLGHPVLGQGITDSPATAVEPNKPRHPGKNKED